MRILRKLACSFCGRKHTEVEKLVAGPRVYICDRCVQKAVEITREATPPPAKPARAAA